MGDFHDPGADRRGNAAGPLPEQAATSGDASALLSGVVRLITAHPALLVDHVQSHASLLSLEVAAAAARLRRQAMWWSGAAFGGLIAAILAGVAALLWMMRPISGLSSVEAAASDWGIAAPWLLASIPAVPLLLAVVCMAGGLGMFRARMPERPGPLERLKTDLAGLQANPQ